jgi:hypothetical protein
MLKLLPLLLFLSPVVTLGQNGKKELPQKLHHKLEFTDSMMIKLKQLDDSVIKIQQTAAARQMEDSMMQRNNNDILELQKEQRGREKKTAFIRIAIGIGLLIILIIGLRRKTVKKQAG